LQNEGNTSVLQQEIGDFRAAISHRAAENQVEEKEMDALHKRDGELVGRFAQAHSRSEDVLKRISQKFDDVFEGPHLEIGGFCQSRNFERVEISRSIDVIGT
jgi:hypothetical protein